MKTSAWQKAIQQLQQSRLAPVPEDWIAPPEFAKTLRISMATARRQLNELVAAGKADRQKFPIMRPGGAIYPTTHYRLKS